MKFRKQADGNPETDGTREEVREMAEALSLYRSAMHHLAEREAARPFAAERNAAPAMRFRFLLAPALTAAVASGVLVPVYAHYHEHHTRAIAARRAPATTQPSVASVDDTALMNQIDSEVSVDVPDALRPLADLSEQNTNSNTASENKNVTQE
jgi:hypothetical protein